MFNGIRAFPYKTLCENHSLCVLMFLLLSIIAWLCTWRYALENQIPSTAVYIKRFSMGYFFSLHSVHNTYSFVLCVMCPRVQFRNNSKLKKHVHLCATLFKRFFVRLTAKNNDREKKDVIVRGEMKMEKLLESLGYFISFRKPLSLQISFQRQKKHLRFAFIWKKNGVMQRTQQKVRRAAKKTTKIQTEYIDKPVTYKPSTEHHCRHSFSP